MEVVLIVGFGVVGCLAMIGLIGYLTLKDSQIKAQAKGLVKGQDQINAATAAELAALRARVQVLEKLVTDDDRKLARDIADLRTGSNVNG